LSGRAPGGVGAIVPTPPAEPTKDLVRDLVGGEAMKTFVGLLARATVGLREEGATN
jgi:hypothetical protein